MRAESWGGGTFFAALFLSCMPGRDSSGRAKIALLRMLGLRDFPFR